MRVRTLPRLLAMLVPFAGAALEPSRFPKDLPGAAAALPVPERSGNGYRTWDLGSTGELSGKHHYAVAIEAAAAPELRLPPRAGEGAFEWTLADGRRVELRLRTTGVRAFAERGVPAAGQPAADADGGALRLSLPRGFWTGGEWRLDTGLALSATTPRGGLPGEFTINDERGAPLLHARFAGVAFKFTGATDGTVPFETSPTAVEAPGGPDMVSGAITPLGTWGGYQCNASAAFLRDGAQANPFPNIPVGVWGLQTCGGDILWNLAGALPATATATGVWLYPVNVSEFGGTAVTVSVLDVDNGRALATASTGYNGALWTDLRTMADATRPVYGAFPVGGTGNYYPQLGSTAIEDLNNRLRSPGWFAVGLRAETATDGVNVRFSSGASTLWVYYVDYAPNQVALNRMVVQAYGNSVPDHLFLYNYGENIDIGNWQVRSIRYDNAISSYTIPAGTILNRHQGLRIIDSTGANGSGTLYTGGNLFDWSRVFVPNPLQVWLQRADGSGADYFCADGATAAPPTGTGWNGSCSPVTVYYGNEIDRARDGDTDGAGDWALAMPKGNALSSPLVNAQAGNRRRSDVVINHFLVYGGYCWISLANLGPDVDLSGWQLEVYDNSGTYGTRNGTYTFPAGSTLAGGEVVWLAEGNYCHGGACGTPADRLHQNLNFDITWDSDATIGGEIALRDKGGRGRDYVAFGSLTHQGSSGGAGDHLPAGLTWTGPFIPVSGTTPDVIRDGDAVSNSAAGWIQQGGYWNWGARGPNSRGAVARQSGIGSPGATSAGVPGYYNYGGGGAFGAGNVISVTRQVALTEVQFQAAPVAAPRNGLVVVKKQGSPNTILANQAVTVASTGQTMVAARFTPPLRLDPGTHAVMLYLDGDWYDNEWYLSGGDRLGFGAMPGVSYEVGFSPTAAFSVNWANYSMHSQLVTVDPPVIGSASSLPGGEETIAYSFNHLASGGVGAYNWSLVSGTLPPGLSLAAGGQLTGTPTAYGDYALRVRVTDSVGMTAEQDETIRIEPRLQIGTAELLPYDSAATPAWCAAASGNAVYCAQLQAFGGVGPYAWSCNFAPALGGGLSCNASGSLGGTLGAVADGTYGIEVTVTDSLGVSAMRTLMLDVHRVPVILTTALPDGFAGIDYGLFQLIGRGGWGVVQWDISAGALPPGITLSPTGGLSGTPGSLGAFNFTVHYFTDAGSAYRPFTLVVRELNAPPYWIRKGLAGGAVRVHFSPNFALDRTALGEVGERSSIVYRSSDGAYFWRALPFEFPQVVIAGQVSNPGITDVAFAPDFDGRGVSGSQILAVTSQNSGFWMSDDGGQTFFTLNTGLGDGAAEPAIHVESPYFAPDFATSRRLYCVSRDPVVANLGIYTGVVNLGARTISWTRVSPATLNLEGAVFSPGFLGDRTVFATDAGIAYYRSTDGGAQWVRVYDFGDNGGGRIEISPNYPVDGVVGIYSAWDQAMLLSVDRGLGFVARGAAYNLIDFRIPADYDAATNRAIYATGAGPSPGTVQLMRSSDNGLTFVPTGTGGLPPSQMSPYFFLPPNFGAAAGRENTILAAGSNYRGMYRSEDGGASWGPADGGLYLQPINAIAVAPNYAGSNRVFLATDAGVYFSVNGGRVWTKSGLYDQTGTPYTPQILALQVSPAFASDNRVFAYACTDYSTCRVLRSTDGGATFGDRTGINQNLPMIQYGFNFQVSPNYASDRRIYINTYTGIDWDVYLFYDGDGGTSISNATSGQPGLRRYRNFAISPAFGADSTILSSSYNGFGAEKEWRFDGWAAFTELSGYPDGFDRPWFAPQFNWNTGANGALSRTVFWNCAKSTNVGPGTAAVFTALPNAQYCGDLVMSPTFGSGSDRTLFSIVRSGAQRGVYRYDDGTGAYTPMAPAAVPGAFRADPVVAISTNYTNDCTVFVGTLTGLFVSRDCGSNWTHSTGTEGYSPRVTAVAQDASVAHRVYIGTADGGVVMSNDDGATTTDITANLPVNAGTQSAVPVNALAMPGGGTGLFAGLPSGLWRRADLGGGGTWSRVQVGGSGVFGDIRSFDHTSSGLYAANHGGPSLVSLDNGLTWSYLSGGLTDAMDIVRVPGSGFGAAGEAPAGSSASLWAASAAGGAFFSTNGGGNWSPANGGNDYSLPASSGYQTIQTQGINAASGGREVLIGHNTQGVFLSRDGGDTWRNVSGAGSGLEATSKNASTFLATATAYGTTDVLVGVNGSTTGGVYLSGDGGEHWTQVNSGFDPASLSIGTLAKSSCAGCPVQYYSGSYGGGMYTRTISVNKPPFYDTPAGWCAGAGCTCAGTTATLAVPGGTSFKICGSNFQAGMVVEFDGVPATGCTLVLTAPQSITCTAPPHAGGAPGRIVVRNTDTRAKALPAGAFNYSGGASRASGSLRLRKSGADVQVGWTCAGCTAGSPARVYRAQNPGFSSFLEQYNGGANGTVGAGCATWGGNNSCLNQATLATNPRSYYWTVE